MLSSEVTEVAMNPELLCAHDSLNVNRSWDVSTSSNEPLNPKTIFLSRRRCPTVFDADQCTLFSLPFDAATASTNITTTFTTNSTVRKGRKRHRENQQLQQQPTNTSILQQLPPPSPTLYPPTDQSMSATSINFLNQKRQLVHQCHQHVEDEYNDFIGMAISVANPIYFLYNHSLLISRTRQDQMNDSGQFSTSQRLTFDHQLNWKTIEQTLINEYSLFYRTNRSHYTAIYYSNVSSSKCHRKLIYYSILLRWLLIIFSYSRVDATKELVEGHLRSPKLSLENMPASSISKVKYSASSVKHSPDNISTDSVSQTGAILSKVDLSTKRREGTTQLRRYVQLPNNNNNINNNNSNKKHIKLQSNDRMLKRHQSKHTNNSNDDNFNYMDDFFSVTDDVNDDGGRHKNDDHTLFDQDYDTNHQASGVNDSTVNRNTDLANITEITDNSYQNTSKDFPWINLAPRPSFVSSPQPENNVSPTPVMTLRPNTPWPSLYIQQIASTSPSLRSSLFTTSSPSNWHKPYSQPFPFVQQSQPVSLEDSEEWTIVQSPISLLITLPGPKQRLLHRGRALRSQSRNHSSFPKNTYNNTQHFYELRLMLRVKNKTKSSSRWYNQALHHSRKVDGENHALQSHHRKFPYSLKTNNTTALYHHTHGSGIFKYRETSCCDKARLLSSMDRENMIESALEKYFTSFLLDELRGRPDVTLVNVTLAVSALSDRDIANLSTRRQMKASYLSWNPPPQPARSLEMQGSISNINYKIMGFVEYGMVQSTTSREDIMNQSASLITDAISDQDVVRQVLTDAGVDTYGNGNFSVRILNVTALSAVSSVQDDVELDSNNNKKERPSLARIISGFVILALTILSLFFWAAVLFKKYRKRRRRKHLAKLRKAGTVVIGGNGAKRRNSNSKPLVASGGNRLSERPVVSKNGSVPPKLIQPASTLSNDDYIFNHSSLANATEASVTALNLTSKDGSQDDDRCNDGSYYQGMITPNITSNASDDLSGVLHFNKSNNTLNTNSSKSINESGSKNLTSVLDQLDLMVELSALNSNKAPNSKQQTQIHPPEAPVSLETSSEKDGSEEGDDSAGVLLASYSRFLLGTPTSTEENELLNQSFPYGDEGVTQVQQFEQQSNKKVEYNNITKRQPQEYDHTQNASTSLEDTKTVGEFVTEDAVEWTEAGMVLHKAESDRESGTRKKNNTLHGVIPNQMDLSNQPFTPYGDSNVLETNAMAASTINSGHLSKPWTSDERLNKDERPPAQYSFVYPLQRQDIHSAGGDSSLLSPSTSSNRGTLHESHGITTFGSNALQAVGIMQTKRLPQQSHQQDKFYHSKTGMLPASHNEDRAAIAASAANILRSAGINLDDKDSDDNDTSTSEPELGILSPKTEATKFNYRSDVDLDNESQLGGISVTESMVREVKVISQYVEQYESLKKAKKSPAVVNATSSSRRTTQKKQVNVTTPLAAKSYDLDADDEAEDDDDDYDDEISTASNTDEQSQRLGISRFSVEIPPLLTPSGTSGNGGVNPSMSGSALLLGPISISSPPTLNSTKARSPNGNRHHHVVESWN